MYYRGYSHEEGKADADAYDQEFIWVYEKEAHAKKYATCAPKTIAYYCPTRVIRILEWNEMENFVEFLRRSPHIQKKLVEFRPPVASVLAGANLNQRFVRSLINCF